MHTRALCLNSNLSWGLNCPRDCFYKLRLLPELHFLHFISLFHVFKKQLVEKRQSDVLFQCWAEYLSPPGLERVPMKVCGPHYYLGFWNKASVWVNLLCLFVKSDF